MATGFSSSYTTRASGDTFGVTAAWVRRETTVKWQANISIGRRLIDDMHGSIEDVPVDSDPTPLVTVIINRELERLNKM